MIEITDNLYVGSLLDLRNFSLEDDAIVHATQTPHYQIMGWNWTTNKPNKNHLNYIIWEKNNRLSLNWVDGPAHLYKWSGIGTFIKVLDFIDYWIENRKILIHCNQGISRSPTLGLLYLAKRRKIVPNDTFHSAKKEFLNIYPMYNPSGISDFVNQHWIEIE
jgi:hypothetical protein